MKANVKTELIKLAAQMVRGQNMPPAVDEYGVHLSRKARIEIECVSERAREQARQWGIAVRDLADAPRGKP